MVAPREAFTARPIRDLWHHPAIRCALFVYGCLFSLEVAAIAYLFSQGNVPITKPIPFIGAPRWLVQPAPKR